MQLPLLWCQKLHVCRGQHDEYIGLAAYKHGQPRQQTQQTRKGKDWALGHAQGKQHHPRPPGYTQG
jgi:hypothetical protein